MQPDTITLDTENEEIIQNIFDKVLLHIIKDSLESGNKLSVVEKPLFDSDTPIERIDVNDSVVMDLAYRRRK